MSPRKTQVFSPNFLVRKFYVNGQFSQISADLPENLPKLSVYGNVPHKEIMWKSLYFMRCFINVDLLSLLKTIQ